MFLDRCKSCLCADKVVLTMPASKPCPPTLCRSLPPICWTARCSCTRGQYPFPVQPPPNKFSSGLCGNLPLCALLAYLQHVLISVACMAAELEAAQAAAAQRATERGQASICKGAGLPAAPLEVASASQQAARWKRGGVHFREDSEELQPAELGGSSLQPTYASASDPGALLCEGGAPSGLLQTARKRSWLKCKIPVLNKGAQGNMALHYLYYYKADTMFRMSEQGRDVRHFLLGVVPTCLHVPFCPHSYP